MITIRRIWVFSSIMGLVLLLVILTSWERSSLDSLDIDFDRLCSVSGLAHEKNDFVGLLLDLERQFNVETKKMRVTENGVYVPVNVRFVNEEGFFIAKPQFDIKENGTDPSFDLVGSCVYRYKIKG